MKIKNDEKIIKDIYDSLKMVTNAKELVFQGRLDRMNDDKEELLKEVNKLKEEIKKKDEEISELISMNKEQTVHRTEGTYNHSDLNKESECDVNRDLLESQIFRGAGAFRIKKKYNPAVGESGTSVRRRRNESVGSR